MEYMWSLIGLYIVYYLVLPLGLIFLVWKMWQKKKTLQGISDFGSRKKSFPEIKKRKGEMERLQVFLIIFILLFIPVSNFVSFQIQERSIEYDSRPVGGLGSIEYRQLRRKLGPSYDIDAIISEMDTYLFSLEKPEYELEEGSVSEDLISAFDEEGYTIEEGWYITEEREVWWITSDLRKRFRIEEAEDKFDIYEKPSPTRDWFINDIRQHVDLERLASFPGRLGVYYLEKRDFGDFMVVSYDYFSPLPVTRNFVFLIHEDRAFFYEENTIVYPSNPSNIDPF